MRGRLPETVPGLRLKGGHPPLALAHQMKDALGQIYGQLIRTNAVVTFPYFAIISDRLYMVSRDTQPGEEVSQLLVPKSCQEIIFQTAHHSPMAGHIVCDKTRKWIMAQFYWPGIHADVQRWCGSCRECQLSNPPAIQKSPTEATTTNGDSIQKNCDGSHHAIRQ